MSEPRIVAIVVLILATAISSLVAVFLSEEGQI